MNLIDRPATHSTPFSDRPIRGGVLHSTQTDQTVTTFQSAGGWHWQIDRDGTVYRDCDESQAAWHVRASDRWRPSWVVPCPGAVTSDVNYSSVGIEIVSGPVAQSGATPYTDAQYAALAELIADIHSRYGPLPWVGHGELQRDRTDPVAFDWTRAGFGLNDGQAGHQYTAPAPQEADVTDAERAVMQATIDNQAGLIAELDGQVSSLTWLLGLAQGERDAAAAEADRLRAEVAAGATLSPEDTEKLARYERIRELVQT